MNRYIVIDLKELCISHLAKVETDFDINEVQTSSITCTDEKDLIKELKKIISEMENWTTEELEIFKRVVRDYRKMEKELNDRVEQGYRIQELYDYIRHLSTCNITNYHIENYDDSNYIDFNYNDMCVSIYENKEGKCYLSNDIEVWNDKEGYLIDYTSIKDLEQLVKEMI